METTVIASSMDKKQSSTYRVEERGEFCIGQRVELMKLGHHPHTIPPYTGTVEKIWLMSWMQDDPAGTRNFVLGVRLDGRNAITKSNAAIWMPLDLG